MSIEFSCPECSKLIRAPDAAGGKHGKCPFCSAKVYIPSPPDESEEISLAPIDETDVRREQQFREEAAKHSAAVSRETDSPPEGAGGSAGSRASAGRSAEAPGDIDEAIGRFVLAMRDSKLDEADRIAEGLRNAGAKAHKHVHTAINDPSSLSVANTPPPLVQGFLKTLLERLS